MKNKLNLFLTIFISFAIISNLNAYENAIPNKYFACKGNFNNFSISPDGKYLLITNTIKDNVCDIMEDKSQPVEDGMYDRGLILLDLETMKSKTISKGSQDDQVSGAGWLSNDRIWYRPSYKMGQGARSIVTFAINIDGSQKKIIHQGTSGQYIYNTALDDPKHVYVYNNERRPTIFDFYRLNIYTGVKKRIAMGPDIGDMKGKAFLGSINYPDGTPLGVLIDEGITRTMYKYNQSNKEWETHFQFNCQEPGFAPVGFYEDKLVVAGSKFAPNGDLIEENDTNALYFYDVETKTFSEKLYQDPDYDVAGLTGSCRPSSGSAIGNRFGSIVGVSYETLRPENVFFDQKAEQAFSSVQAVFPDDYVDILTASGDWNVMVVMVENTNNPGDYYLVDFTRGSVSLLYQRNPWLDRNKLVKATPVQYTARDGLEIPALLTLTNKKTEHNYLIVMPHGGPNTKQWIYFDGWAQFLVNKGYNVLQPDFRGSTGLGTSHYKAGNLEWGKKMQDDITDGVLWAIDNGFADADRVCIAGASYGGYATMAGLVFTPDLYRCGINAIGVTDQEQLLENFANKASRFQSWDEEPLLEWGDLSTPEGKEYAKEISPILHIENIKAPVLILHGSNDRVVPVFHAEDLESRLKRLGKTYDAMYQAYEGHCVTSCGEQAALEYLDKQEEFLIKYLEN